MFIADAAFSLRDGITELVHPSTTSSFAVAYVVLGISAVLDLLSFRQGFPAPARPAHPRQAGRCGKGSSFPPPRP